MKRLTLEVAENLAKRFRVEQGLGTRDSISLKSLLRKLNILTLFRPLSERFYGMSLKSPSGLSCILVNSESVRGRQHFTIGHELYHLFYDENPAPHICAQEKNTGIDSGEFNANLFASALLMPEDGIRGFVSNSEIKKRQVDFATIIKMEHYYCVSRKALLIRLKTLKLISANDYEKLSQLSVVDTAKMYGYDTSLYQKGNEGLFIGDFGEKARSLFEQEVISEGHYQELLNLIANE